LSIANGLNPFQLLSVLYKAGATDLVEATFDEIRGRPRSKAR